MTDPDDASLRGRCALVTGGGSGIGFGCAQQLVARGARVTLAARRADVLADAAERLRDAGGDVLTASCDVTDEEQVAAAVEIAADGGSLDVLVANAGSAAPGSITGMGKGEWEFTLGLNVIGTALCIKHAALSMKKRGGAIVAISSTSGTKVQPWMATYVTSKAAVDMLVRAAAIELSPCGIRVNSIQPGYVPTEISTSLFPQALDETLVRATPLGRSGTPADIGAMVAFLATDAASWITGQTFGVDGGLNIPVMPSMAPLADVLFGSEVVKSTALPDFTALNVDGGNR